MNNAGKKPKARGLVRRFLGNNRGNATIMVTLAAIPMVACAGIAIDYMRGLRSASELQGVTDAAALAAASARNVTGTISQQLTQRAAIATKDITASVANVADMQLVGSPSVVTGPNTIDVTVNAKVKGSLANVLNLLPKGGAAVSAGSGGAQAGATSSTDINLSVHSKVGFSKESYLCLLALNPTATNAIYFQGNSEFMATCAVQANSSATVAMRTWGSAEAYATSFCTVFPGGWAGSGFEPNPQGGCSYKSDPYASLTLPAAGTPITAAQIPTATSVSASTGVTVKNTTATLKPGTYYKGLHITTHGVANLEPGLYIIKDGKLDVDADSTLNATGGVTFYLTGSNAYIDIKSGAVVKIVAPKTGTASNYKGMAIMQDRRTGYGAGNTNTLYSKGGVNIDGTFYTPYQKLVVWANDTMNGTSKYFPMIVDTLNMNGTATLYVNLDYTGAGFPEPTELKQSGKVFVSQ